MIIYSKTSGMAEGAIGRLDTPIKMLIEHESDLMKKKGGICDWLFNKEKSKHFAETVITENGFDSFSYVAEGEGAVKDCISEAGYKIIEHLQFMKEFTITAEMMEDAGYGIATDAKRRIQNFVRSYYQTVNKACAAALINGMDPSVNFAGGLIHTTTYDGFPLFHAKHRWGVDDNRGEQANYYCDNFAKIDDNTYSIEKAENSLYKLAANMRNMKDENGEPMGYVADTIILPGNQPKLEQIMKRICGSENVVNSANNDINIHYGNWSIIVLPTWTTNYDEMMIMSSEANKALAGNLFFDRVPLTVSSWVDHHTGNYNWTGRCRFGIGFGTYKHIIKITADDDYRGNAASLPEI